VSVGTVDAGPVGDRIRGLDPSRRGDKIWTVRFRLKNLRAGWAQSAVILKYARAIVRSSTRF
jgi:hypothetical protein